MFVITSYSIHYTKLYDLVWVTDFASGQPVAGAKISLYKANWPGLVASPQVLASGVSDEHGLVRLPGSEEVDPKLRSLGSWRNNLLIIRCEKGEDLALMPLNGAFSNGSGLDDYDEGYYNTLRRKYVITSYSIHYTKLYESSQALVVM